MDGSSTVLQFILFGCKVALAQGRFRWRHNQVRRKLAELLEECRVGQTTPQVITNRFCPWPSQERTDSIMGNKG